MGAGPLKDPTTANPTIGLRRTMSTQRADFFQTKGPHYGWGAAAPHTPRDFRGAAPLELPAREGPLHRKSGLLIYPMVGFTMVRFVRS